MDIIKALRRDIERFTATGQLPRERDTRMIMFSYDTPVEFQDIPEPTTRASTQKGAAFGRWLQLVFPSFDQRARDVFDYVFRRGISRQNTGKIVGCSAQRVGADIRRLKTSIAAFCGIPYTASDRVLIRRGL